MGDPYLWRQVFILTPPILLCVSGGIMITFPSVLLPAIMSTNNTDIEVTKDQASWITTSNGFAGILGLFTLPPIQQVYGRKPVYIVICLIFVIGWVILTLAHNVTALIAARFVQGIDMGSVYIHGIIISEYVDPKRRGYFMISRKVAVAVGILLCHALSLIWNWRQIATFALFFPILAVGLTLLWPESPFFLAMKGRYKESENSFIWLRGTSNMQELHLLHSYQLQESKRLRSEKCYKFLCRKDFVKSFIIVSLLTFIIEFSGKHYFAIYAIQMMTELFEDKSIALYVSIGADLFTFVALILSFSIIRYFKRRTVLFSFGVTTVTLMLLICIVIVFKSSSMAWLVSTLIVLHNFIVNSSIAPVCFILWSEMFPLEHKGWGSSLNGIMFVSSYTLLLKLTPELMQSTGVGGLYAIYGIIITICLIVLYGIMPETKDKTLQEIENDLKGVDLSNRDVPNNIMLEGN